MEIKELVEKLNDSTKNIATFQAKVLSESKELGDVTLLILNLKVCK